MTQATHTPAPWDWQDGVLIGDLDGEGGDVSFAEIGNARLIAAAPDMLAALTNLIALTELHIAERSKTPEEEDDFLACYHILQARAAITKARGE